MTCEWPIWYIPEKPKDLREPPKIRHITDTYAAITGFLVTGVGYIDATLEHRAKTDQELNGLLTAHGAHVIAERLSTYDPLGR